tara:strand:+ start:361 stop:1734 length:1374 start_codon:yes stop_codon:yes gene_type:complete
MSFYLLERYKEAKCLQTNENDFVSYLDLAKRSDEIVKNLPKRSLFILYFEPSIDCIAVYLGALRNNHVALLIDPSLDDVLKDKIINKFRIKFKFNGNKWTKTKFCNESKDGFDRNLSILLSTSGSTGSPKLIKISKKNLVVNANSIVAYLGLNKDDRAISSLPLHYSYGLSILNTHLLVGAKFYLTNLPVTNKKFWSFFKENEITNMSGVPATWRILRKLFFDRMNLPSLKFITQAGGKLSVEEVKWLAELGKISNFKVFIMYGQTEATARISYLKPDMILKKSGSIGKVIPNGKLYLKGENNRNIYNSNQEGELIYKGENVMMGYASEISDLKKRPIKKELYTGDLAYFDEDGYFWITGRKKRFLKIFGNRFSMDDIESFLYEKGFEASVIGKDDKLIVVICKEENKNSDDLITLLSNFYKIHFSAMEVIMIDKIPRSSSGKTEYKKLSEICGLDF